MVILISCNGEISNLTITWSILTFSRVFHEMVRGWNQVKTGEVMIDWIISSGLTDSGWDTVLIKMDCCMMPWYLLELPRTGEACRWTTPGISGSRGRTGNHWRDTRSRQHTSHSPARGCWCWGGSSTSTEDSVRGSPPDRMVLTRVLYSCLECSIGKL